MNDKELWELMSIICEGQDSEQRRKVEQYITDLQKEIERLNKELDKTRLSELNKEYIINELEKYLNEQIQKSWEIEEQCYEDIESKLQELKGSNNEKDK